MGYIFIMISVYNCCAMESAEVDYDKLVTSILGQMLDLRSGGIICKTKEVSTLHDTNYTE